MSLKDKRRILLSLKDRIGRDNAVAIAEVGNMDMHKSAVMGIVAVSNSTERVHTVLDKILERLRGHRQIVISGHRKEILTGQ